jgi:hypothetical protein
MELVEREGSRGEKPDEECADDSGEAAVDIQGSESWRD